MKGLTIFVLFYIICCIYAVSESRLYTAVGDLYVGYLESPDDYIPDIEINTAVDSLWMAEIGPYYNSYKAYCSVKQLSDSFYVINSDPLKLAFADMSINTYDDTTLDGKVRVTVLTKYSLMKQTQPSHISNLYTISKDKFSGHTDDGIYLWEYTPGKDHLNFFNIYFEPTYGDINHNHLLDKHMGMEKDDYVLKLHDNPVFQTPNKSIVIKLPNFSDAIFLLYYIPNEIIILTDDKLVWNGITYRRSRFNSFKEKQQNINSLKPWPWVWRSRPNNCY